MGWFPPTHNKHPLIFQDGGNFLVAVDEGQEHTMSVWDWQRGERGSKITETKVRS